MPFAKPADSFAGRAGIRGRQGAGAESTAGRRLRVLALCDHVGYEGRLHGSGRVMVEMAAAFQGEEVQVHACVLQGDEELESKLRDQGIPLTFLGYHRFDPRQIGELVTLIRRHSIDLVHAWDFGAATYGRIAALLTGRPAIIHIQSHHSQYQRRGFPWYARLAYRLLARYTVRAVALAPSIREFAIEKMGFREDQMVTIPNPAPRTLEADVPPERVAELRDTHGLPEHVPVIGTLTRLFEAKGLEYLIDAMPTILESCPQARVLILGDGPLRADLERRARQLELTDRIRFLGFQQDVAAHLRLFTVMVMPSLEEGMPLAALESVAAGVPVVATRVGGLPDVVLEGETGMLVEPGDADGLAKVLVRVLGDPELQESLRQGCLRQRHRFSFDNFQQSLTRLYREVQA
ncbi:MAG TPA: glycosyltransferase [Thermoanaerobaculia bacterium]|nr:glycosyltransferase [Thermoanaerobaculia bacterium]